MYQKNVEEAKALLIENPNYIFARSKDLWNAWHAAAASGNMPVRPTPRMQGPGIFAEAHLVSATEGQPLKPCAYTSTAQMLEMLGAHGRKGAPNRKPIPGEPS